MNTHPISPPVSEAARLILEGFASYLAEWREITHRAPQRFARQEWAEIQADSRERLNLYKRNASRLARSVRRVLGAQRSDTQTWVQIRDAYATKALRLFEFEIALTFFNSVCRQVFDELGADPAFMFVADLPESPQYESAEPIYRSYAANRPVGVIVREFLADYALTLPFENLEEDILHLSAAVQAQILSLHRPHDGDRLEMLKPVFYRNKGAYLVGRVHIDDAIVPIILPLLHGEKGIYIDTLITDPGDVSIIFSLTRSHFLVDVQIPSELVRFLSSIMAQKPIGDIYNSIGFNKHGKTEFYRALLRHLAHSDDQFVIAPGIKGLVMAVFTLPAYNVVFKLIKDKCEPPKKVTRGEVKAKYKLVSRHDRVGRMADTHEFAHFAFDKSRFSPELLEELYRVVPSLLEEKDGQLIIRHLYTERKMIPLNLFLEDAAPEAFEEVIGEYGNAIKQLAAANIFPGDMLLKNFGVTRYRRVVFYDYDEIGFLTEYNFREMPKAQSMEEIYAPAPWFAVGEKDVFPREFEHFLIGREGIREIFVRQHADLFEVDFWHRMQERQRRGEILDVFPYRRRQRFRAAEQRESPL